MYTSGIWHLRHYQVYPRCQQSPIIFFCHKNTGCYGKLFSETTCAQVHTLLCTTVAHKKLVHCNKVATEWLLKNLKSSPPPYYATPSVVNHAPCRKLGHKPLILRGQCSQESG